MTQVQNPLSHQHAHDHDHDHDDIEVQLDPGQQALADALRVCFGLLKIVMVALIVIYCFSNVFYVPQQQKAVRLFFGKIVGEPGRQELEPGRLYFAAPYPIMQVVYVPTAPQELVVDRAFWYEQSPSAQAAGQAKPLNPEKDGSLITGDANIIHVKWTLTYAVTDTIPYVRNVGSIEQAQRLVQAAAEEAIVQAVAQTTADAASKGNVNADLARVAAQQTLDDLETGITIRTFTAGNPVFPLSVQSAFDAVTNADTRRGEQITQAYRQRNQILQEAAGGAYEPLWDLVHEYEVALQAEDEAERQRLAAALDQALDTLEVVDEAGIVHKIGGQVATMMLEAQAYRSNVVQEITAEVDTFNRLREHWRQNRQVLEATYLAEVRQEILGNARETFWMPAGQFYLELNRDPAVERAEEEARLAAEEEARRNPNR